MFCVLPPLCLIVSCLEMANDLRGGGVAVRLTSAGSSLSLAVTLLSNTSCAVSIYITHVGVKARAASRDPIDNDLWGGGGHSGLSNICTLQVAV